MLGSQEKILEPKVNVKFFTVDPYTQCNRVSRYFPNCPIWQVWSLFGQKNVFFSGLDKSDRQLFYICQIMPKGDTLSLKCIQICRIFHFENTESKRDGTCAS